MISLLVKDNLDIALFNILRVWQPILGAITLRLRETTVLALDKEKDLKRAKKAARGALAIPAAATGS